MANKYELRKFEPVNNKTYQFQEVSVNGKYLFQEFLENLKDQRDVTTQHPQQHELVNRTR